MIPLSEIKGVAGYGPSDHPLSVLTFEYYKKVFELGYGEFLDPIELIDEGDGFRVVEGTHRVAAAHAAGATHIRAVVL